MDECLAKGNPFEYSYGWTDISITHVDRTLRGEGAFTIQAAQRLAGFAIHSDKPTIEPVEMKRRARKPRLG